jgi:anti-sigma factor (TIGR02949 family)
METPEAFTCREVFARLDDYLDRELTAEEMAMVSAHLETCAECAGEYRFERGVLEDVRGKLRRLAVPGDLLSRITARIAAEAADKKQAD